jgi:hypothetical protein
MVGESPGLVGGAFGLETLVIDCAIGGRGHAAHSYSAVYDYITGRWSAPTYLYTSCLLL